MYCKNCGTEVKEGQPFCSSCGTKLIEETKSASVEVVDTKQNQAGCWKIFANLGFLFGLISLISFVLSIIIWVGFTYISFSLAPVGLIFSILGKKSNVNGKRAKVGIILSSISLGLSMLMVFIGVTLITSEIFSIFDSLN